MNLTCPCHIGHVDGRVQTWSLQGYAKHRLLGHSNSVTSVSFNPDQTMLVSSSFDCSIRVWALDSGQCVSFLPNVEFISPPTCAVSVHGQLVTCCSDGVRIYAALSSLDVFKLVKAPDSSKVSFVDNRIWVLLDGRLVIFKW